MGVIGGNCVSVIGVNHCVMGVDSCRAIDRVSALIIVVLVGIIICVSDIAITGMGTRFSHSLLLLVLGEVEFDW